MSNDNENANKPDPRISMMLHPESLLSEAEILDVPQTRGQVVIQQTSAAVRVLKKELGLVLDARQAAFSDIPQSDIRALQRHQKDRNTPLPATAVSTPEGIQIALSTAVATTLNSEFEKSVVRAGIGFDKAMKVATETHDFIAEAVREKLTDPSAGKPYAIAQAAETRSLLRGMTALQRTEFFAARIAENDLATVHAALASPAFLSGMNKAEQDALRSRAELHFAPVESKQRDAAAIAIQKTIDASQLFLKEIQKARIYVAPDKRSAALDRLRKGGE